MTAHQKRLLDHWLKYMPTHTAYIEDAIKRHFESAPWDRDELRPLLVEARRQIK